MTPDHLDLDKLEIVAKAATPGPWEPDTQKSEGCYGTGEDVHEGYDAYVMHGPKDFHGSPEVLFDTFNSTSAEVHDECDENGHYAWDEVARRNFAFIAAMREYALALIALARKAEAAEARADALAAENEKLRREISYRELGHRGQ